MKSLINGGCAGVNSPVAAMLFYSERTSLKKKARCAPSHRKKLGNSAELIAFPQLEFLTPPAISEAITNSPHQARTQIGGRSFFEEVSSQVYQEIPTLVNTAPAAITSASLLLISSGLL
jgi:hypothetical protein